MQAPQQQQQQQPPAASAAARHPCTLLGAARALLLQPAAGDAGGLRLQAEAASLLGDHARARRLWGLLARDGDLQAQARLAQLEQARLDVQRERRPPAGFSGPRCPR